MKNQRLVSILGSAVLTGAVAMVSFASPQSAAAQTGGALARANIPFAFSNGNQQMPAGTYLIERASNHVLMLRGSSGVSGLVMMNSAIASHTPAHGYIVFDRYGDKYFLHQIWTANEKEGFETTKSRAEKEALQAKNNQPATSFELAINSVLKQ